MTDLSITYQPPSADEFIGLRNSVGWGCPDKETVTEGLKNSLFSVCIRLHGELIGYGRVIGDRAFTLYIQDVIVKPAFQRQRIGTNIMDEIMNYIKSSYKKGCMVCLMASKGREGFYKKYDFIERPNEKFGAGMIQFI